MDMSRNLRSAVRLDIEDACLMPTTVDRWADVEQGDLFLGHAGEV